MTAIAAPGEVLGGRYRLIRELGRGAMGALYEAEHLRTRRWVALRVLRSEPADGSAEAVTRFEREARVAERLRHPNVVALLDRGDDPERGVVFIVHELLAGGDLGQCLQTAGTLAPRVALATLLPVMDALSAAHARGVFHRDVRAESIFLHAGSWGVTPKLRGFGRATIVSLDDERDADGREDVLSMGMVLRRCLSTPETLPADLASAIERAVEEDRERRWSSMEGFAAALRGCALWQGVDEARSRRWVVNALGETAEPPPTMGSDVTAPLMAVAPRRGGRWRPMAAMAAMALAGAAALWPGETSVEPRAQRPRAETRVTWEERPAGEREAETETETEATAAAAESAPTDVGAATARAAPSRGARRVNPVIRRGQGLRAPAGSGARGFNGAPIIE